MSKRLITTHQFLSAYEQGEIGYMEASRGIGVTGFREFLAVLLENGFHLPRDRGPETAEQVEGAVRILSGHMHRDTKQ